MSWNSGRSELRCKQLGEEDRMRVVCVRVLVAIGLVLATLLFVGSRIDSEEEMAIYRTWDIVAGLMFAAAYVLSRRSPSSSAVQRRWIVALKATLIGVTIGGGLVVFQEAVYLARTTVSPRMLAANQVLTVINILQEYRDDHGKYPATEQGLGVLLEPGQQSSQPYARAEMLIDPWGHPLQYAHQGEVIKVWSCGPDGRSGTEDDIVLTRPSNGEQQNPP